ncbi:MAG: hypothetical protein V3W34_10295 [Phycisphaerae bacterium]
MARRRDSKGSKGSKSSEVTIDCVRSPRPATPSDRVTRVALQFGVPTTGQPVRVLDRLTVPMGPGRIVLFQGPSGSGKSTALGLISRHCPGGHQVNRVSFASGRSVIDAICPHQPLGQALELLAACGLGESPLWVRSFDELSDGQRFRARLAKAVGRHLKGRSPAALLCDEFASGLHRRLAKAIAFNLRKLATRYGLSMVMACSDEDVERDLQPDVTFRLRGGGRYDRIERRPRKRAISFSRRLVIEGGGKRDYDAFAAMHYRDTDELGFVDKVFVMREGQSTELLGIVVYSHGPMELSLRNQATAGRFKRNPKRLNREVRILRRLVVHPDVRGCGLGHWLVKKTLPMVGTRFVECLASMGEVNPVFEKAGMTRVGTCAMPSNRARILAEVQALGADPFGREFVMLVSRRPRVRRLVAQLVYQWYQATTAGGEKRVERQSAEMLARTFRGLVGTRPVYFLWERA